jgi:hypothetical protein
MGMELSMKDTGRMIWLMVKEDLLKLILIFIKDIELMLKQKVMVFILIQMVLSIKVSG